MAVKVPLSRVINYLFNHAVIFVILCSIIQALLYARLIGNGLFDIIMRTLFIKLKETHSNFVKSPPPPQKREKRRTFILFSKTPKFYETQTLLLHSHISLLMGTSYVRFHCLIRLGNVIVQIRDKRGIIYLCEVIIIFIVIILMRYTL